MAESAHDDLQSSPHVSTEVSLSFLRSLVSEFSDSHDSWLSKKDFEKKIDKIGEWVEKQKKSSADKSIKEGIENWCKIATATASAIQKFQSGDASDIVSGTMEIISSVATFAGAAVGGPGGAAVGAIIGTVCSIIGAVLAANKPKKPSVVEKLANVVHNELVDFNKKLQDQTHSGLVGRVKEQILQLRTMKHGEKLADPNLWTDYVQFMGELSNRFESPLPFKYEDNLTKDPDVADFVAAVVTYCKVYNCLMALLVTAKGKFSDLDGERHFRSYMKMVDLKISSQREDAEGKLAFLSDKKYLTFLGRLPSEGGKLTKIVALCRNSEARSLVQMVTRGFGLPRLPDLETVESKAKIVSRQSVKLKLEGVPKLPQDQIQFINKTKFPMKIICATVGRLLINLKFIKHVVQPHSFVEKQPDSKFSFGGYIIIYLDGKVQSDDQPHNADVTRVIEFAVSDPFPWASRKVNIQDKTGSEFTRGQDTYDKMEDGDKKTIYWVTNGLHYMACGSIISYIGPGSALATGIPNFKMLWRFVIQDFDPFVDVETTTE